MPLKRFNFQAGIKREGTAYNNEGAFYDASFIRWRSGRAEKMGGWVFHQKVNFDQAYPHLELNLSQPKVMLE